MNDYKKDFPLLIQNPDIHYLDSAATAQRPQAVLDGLLKYFMESNGNAGRGSHSLAIRSSMLIDETRKKRRLLSVQKIQKPSFLPKIPQNPLI